MITLPWEDSTMRIAIYLRCSTKQHQTTDGQREALESWAQRAGHEVVEVFEDFGVSGSKASRPGLDRLMQGAHRREFDAVAVTKLDRLFRSTKHLLETVDQLDHLGVGLIPLDQPALDTTGPAGRLTLTVLGAVAEFERDLICSRVKEGLARAKMKGKKLGNPGLPASTEARICALLDSGVNISEIARSCGVTRPTVYRVKRDLEGDPRREYEGPPSFV